MMFMKVKILTHKLNDTNVRKARNTCAGIIYSRYTNALVI